MPVEGLAAQYIDWDANFTKRAIEQGNACIEHYDGALVKKCISIYSKPEGFLGPVQYVIAMIVEFVRGLLFKTTWQEAVEMMTNRNIGVIPTNQMRPESDNSPEMQKKFPLPPRSMLTAAFNKENEAALRFYIQLHEAGEKAINPTTFNAQQEGNMAFNMGFDGFIGQLNGNPATVSDQVVLDKLREWHARVIKLPGITKEYYAFKLNALSVYERIQPLLNQLEPFPEKKPVPAAAEQHAATV